MWGLPVALALQTIVCPGVEFHSRIVQVGEYHKITGTGAGGAWAPVCHPRVVFLLGDEGCAWSWVHVRVPQAPRPAERGKGPLSRSEPDLGLHQLPQPGGRAHTEGLQGPGV